MMMWQQGACFSLLENPERQKKFGLREIDVTRQISRVVPA
jgi:hypothetical protein